MGSFMYKSRQNSISNCQAPITQFKQLWPTCLLTIVLFILLEVMGEKSHAGVLLGKVFLQSYRKRYLFRPRCCLYASDREMLSLFKNHKRIHWLLSLAEQTDGGHQAPWWHSATAKVTNTGTAYTTQNEIRNAPTLQTTAGEGGLFLMAVNFLIGT